MKPTLLTISPELAGERVDKALALILNEPRAFVQKALENGAILLDNNVVKASYRVRENDVFTYVLQEELPLSITATNIPLDIVYEDNDFLVINKQAGLVVHPSFGHKDDTLVNALLYHQKKLSDVNGEFRPGIVHRLDKDTSGLLIVCKNNKIHEAFAKMFKEHKVHREYTALAYGSLNEEAGRIKTYLKRSNDNYQKMVATSSEGKLAITEFKVIERFPGHILLSLNLQTGRTHQIRAHLEFIGLGIVGDPLYGEKGRKIKNNGQLLHSTTLRFVHPFTKEEMSFSAPLPKAFGQVLDSLR